MENLTKDNIQKAVLESDEKVIRVRGNRGNTKKRKKRDPEAEGSQNGQQKITHDASSKADDTDKIINSGHNSGEETKISSETSGQPTKHLRRRRHRNFNEITKGPSSPVALSKHYTRDKPKPQTVEPHSKAEQKKHNRRHRHRHVSQSISTLDVPEYISSTQKKFRARSMSPTIFQHYYPHDRGNLPKTDSRKPEKTKSKRNLLRIIPNLIKASKAARLRLFDIPDFVDEGLSPGSAVDEEWLENEHYSDDQLDEEWLGIDREYRAPAKVDLGSSTDKKVFKGDKQLNLGLDPGCEEFMASMKFFWWTLQLGGRMPFQTYISNQAVRFKLNKASIPFIYFSITSAFLTFCTTTMAYSFIKIFFVKEDLEGALSFVERIERLDIDKYWIYSVVTFVSAVISSSWSLATIFDDGFFLADFLSRWNVAINALKYRPVARIRLYFWLNAFVYLVYAGIVIILFETDYIPAVRGASGLVGLTILRPFFHELRFNRYYPIIQRFGLLVHLYTTFSSRAILLMVTLYCKVLVNVAMKWNLRLAYVLGMIGETMKTEGVTAVISFQKLFIEHTIVVGFLRHTGRIFAVAVEIFYVLKMFELLILIYSTSAVLLYPLPNFNQTIVQGTPDYLPIITYTDPPFTVIVTVILLLLHSIAEWLVTSEQIVYCGEVILDGYGFVRRWGIMLSKTSQRRRFVQSINHAFSHATDYYVRAGFTINREFTFNIFFWLCTFSAFLTAFHPFQLQKELITACNEKGICVGVVRSRISWQVSSTSRQELVASILEEMERRNPTNETTSTATMPPPTMPPPTITNPIKKVGAFGRCSYIDAVRQNVYDSNGNPFSLELESKLNYIECVGRPYKKGLEYFDIFGNPVTEFDDCGHPRLPDRTNFVGKYGSPNSSNAIVHYPKKVPITLKITGYLYYCWDLSEYNTDDDLLHEEMKEEPPYQCGYPSEWANFFCRAWSILPNTNDMLSKVPSRGVELERQDRGDSGISSCTTQTYDLSYRLNMHRNKVKIVDLDSDLVSKDPKNPFRAFHPFGRTRNGKLQRMKGNARYLFYPYRRRSLTDPGRPYNMYDCFGYKLDEYDDFDNLPFSITRIGSNGFERRKPKKMRYSSTDGIVFHCWEQQVPSYICGFENSTQILNRIFTTGVDFSWYLSN